MEHEVRGDPHAIDAEWMTGALEKAGIARGATVISLELMGLIGTGQMGRNARYSLTWDDPEGRPATVVGKFPAADETARATGFDGSYQKEWFFYRELRRTVGVRTPDVWVALLDDVAKDFVLIMEDMKGCEQGDQFRGLDVEQAMLGIEQAVAFHAPRWGDEDLKAHFAVDAAEGAGKLAGIYSMVLEMSLARLGDLVDEPSRQLARDFEPLVGQWALGTDTPYTLVHMDYRPDNFLFGTGPDAPPLAIVDWATITYALGTHDVAYMIGGSFEPEERRRVERDLVRHYCTLLNEQGVDYDQETCWRDYCISSLWGVVMSIIATMLAQETERGNRMLATMLRRHAWHAIDCGALDLLRAGAS